MYQNNPIIFDVQYHSSGHDGQVFDIHTHNQIEIIQTLSDSGNLLVNNSIYPIQTGSVYLINGLKPHCARPSLTKKYLRNKLFVNYSFFKDFRYFFNFIFIWKNIFSKIIQKYFFFLIIIYSNTFSIFKFLSYIH